MEASSTLTTLIHEFDIKELIFTGVAGALDPLLNAGDIVLASELVKHDMDVRPLMPRYEIPLLGKKWFDADFFQPGSKKSPGGSPLRYTLC